MNAFWKYENEFLTRLNMVIFFNKYEYELKTKYDAVFKKLNLYFIFLKFLHKIFYETVNIYYIKKL